MTSSKAVFHKSGYIEKQDDVFEKVKLLKEGLWYIKTIDDGVHYKFIADKVDDLPAVKKLSEIEPYRYIISKNIKALLDSLEDELSLEDVMEGNLQKILPTKRIVDVVFQSILDATKEK